MSWFIGMVLATVAAVALYVYTYWLHGVRVKQMQERVAERIRQRDHWFTTVVRLDDEVFRQRVRARFRQLRDQNVKVNWLEEGF